MIRAVRTMGEVTRCRDEGAAETALLRPRASVAWSSVRFQIDTTLDQEGAFVRAGDLGRLGEWDPAVRESSLVEGSPLTRGAVYRVTTSRWLGEVTFIYRVVAIDPPRLVTYRGGSERVTSTDTIVVVPTGIGSRVAIESVLAMTGRDAWALPAVKGLVWLTRRSLSLPALRRRLIA